MRTNANGAGRSFTLTGLAFGVQQGSVKLDNAVMKISSWSDRQIKFTVPNELPNDLKPGPHQLKITTAGGKTTVNALTFHLLNPVNSNGLYNPTIFEVGIGKAYDPTSPIRNVGDPANGIGSYEHALQDALNDAANVAKALVVVYPGPVDLSNPRYNGRGAYYENVVIHSPLKLQGVGPGGVYPDGTPVQGTILDGIAFGGDTNMAEAFRVLVTGLTRAGNQDIAEGQVIYVLPGTTTQFSASNTNNFAAAIDGINIRGGDQMGFPGNLNAIFGGYPGPVGGVNAETQGGAIFANAYASYLQITNNIIENNSGTYGTIRIGTPNIDTGDNHNDHVRIAYNRIVANGGTNLAGAIGLFGGSNNYEIANNDVCGNFSAEYGGAISHFGLSPSGKIHDNRIYFNHAYDEGGGIIIAGELAAVPTAAYGQPGGPQGSGAVSIYNNLIQGNMSEDDGGGLRFLMAGNFPMNVYNNMLVNNIATHEGGGVAIDDAPNIRFLNNTVMNNKTTATAITSDGSPAPAGLSTGPNSDQLQASLPLGAAAFSNPLLFNNIFWDNWAGTKGTNTVTGITPADAYYWDMGVLGSSYQLSPTNSILHSETVNHNDVIASPTNKVDQNPLVFSSLDIPLSFTSWRTNINFIGAIMVTADLPPSLLSDYHLFDDISPAYNAGAVSIATPSGALFAPTFDIDNQGRPGFGSFDAGADEIPNPIADLSITKTDGQTSVLVGSVVTYTIAVSNAGPNGVSGANITDNLPAVLSNVSWSCAAVAGSSCTTGGAGNNRTGTVTLPAGGSAVFTARATLSPSAVGSLTNTASVTMPAGFTTDPTAANNTASDTDTISVPLPTLTVLDNFNRANATTLGSNWSQIVLLGRAAIQNQSNQAFAAVPGFAYWNNPTTGYGSKQGAAFTFVQNGGSPSAPQNGSSLLLKVTNGSGSTSNPANYLRVQYQTSSGGQVVVQWTNNGNVLSPAYTTLGTFASGTFVTGDRLLAVANADGSVDVWKTSAANVTTYLGHSAASTFTGTGRIGIQLPTNARIDDFRGGTLP